MERNEDSRDSLFPQLKFSQVQPPVKGASQGSGSKMSPDHAQGTLLIYKCSYRLILKH